MDQSEESDGKHNVHDQIEHWSRNRSIDQSTNHSTLQYHTDMTNLKKKRNCTHLTLTSCKCVRGIEYQNIEYPGGI